jgi:hypothetical protein
MQDHLMTGSRLSQENVVPGYVEFWVERHPKKKGLFQESFIQHF